MDYTWRGEEFLDGMMKGWAIFLKLINGLGDEPILGRGRIALSCSLPADAPCLSAGTACSISKSIYNRNRNGTLIMTVMIRIIWSVTGRQHVWQP